MDMELLTASYEDVISTLEDSNIELTRERDEQNEQLFTLNAQVTLCVYVCIYVCICVCVCVCV